MRYYYLVLNTEIGNIEFHLSSYNKMIDILEAYYITHNITGFSFETI